VLATPAPMPLRRLTPDADVHGARKQLTRKRHADRKLDAKCHEKCGMMLVGTTCPIMLH
jgi:hypothetical protein